MRPDGTEISINASFSSSSSIVTTTTTVNLLAAMFLTLVKFFFLKAYHCENSMVSVVSSILVCHMYTSQSRDVMAIPRLCLGSHTFLSHS